jgi:PAS domain S-box-containing protein
MTVGTIARKGRRSVLGVPRALIGAYFGVLLIVLAATVPVLIGTVRTLDREQNVFDPASAAAEGVLVGALNQETGIRGYALTGDPTFLQPYEAGLTQYDQSIRDLDDADLGVTFAQDVAATSAAFGRWQQFAKQVYDEVAAGNERSARNLIEQSRGKTLFDQFRARQGALASTVDQQVTASRRSLHSQVDESLIALMVAILVGVGVGVGIWIWWRLLGRRSAIQEQRLADSAILLQSAIDATTEGIFVKDLQGRHTLANKARAATLAGPSSDADLIGRSEVDFLDPATAEIAIETEKEVLLTGAQRQFEQVIEDADGQHTFSIIENPLRDAQGETIGIVGVARDVTSERELLANRDRLYQLEHEMAETLQRGLLGNSTVDDDRISVFARYKPAIGSMEVGGDWYDVLPIDGDRIALIVGDAVGHGIESVTAMGQLRSALSALTNVGFDPAATIQALDESARSIVGAHCATCVLAIVDPANERLDYSCAGHMPPLVVTETGGPLLLDGFQDPPLAATERSIKRRTTSVAFPTGSTLLLFTDGLVERRYEPIDAGLRRLKEQVEARIGEPVADICDELMAELVDPNDQSDDVALVVARSVAKYGRRFRREVMTDALEVRRFRHAFGEWLSYQGLEQEAGELLVLAASEAVANSVEHAYGSSPGVTRVEAVKNDGVLRVTVKDEGKWRTGPANRWRGRGLRLMETVTDRVEISTDGPGTTVMLELDLARSRAG